MTGSPDWSGTALLHGATLVYQANIPIAAGASISQYLQFTKPGYLVNVSPQYTGASGSNPYCRVHWQWEDVNPATADMGYSRWVVPVHASGVYVPVIGSGPVRGPWLQLRISNLDGVQPVTFGITVYETTQHIARDDWREQDIFGLTPPPGATMAPGAAPGQNELAAMSVSLTGNQVYQLPLYAGQAWLSLDLGPAAGATADLTIAPILPNIPVYDTGQITGKTVVNQQAITMPREPCKIQVVLTGTSVAVTLALITMEYAS